MADRVGEMVEVIARDIWRFNECPWDFDNPGEGMAALQKQLAVDQAKGIVVALAKADRERAKKIARFVMTGDVGSQTAD